MANIAVRLKRIAVSALLLTSGLFHSDFSTRYLQAESAGELESLNSLNSANGLEAENIVSVYDIPHTGDSKWVPGQVIVKLKEGRVEADIQDLNAKHKVGSMKRIFKEIPLIEDSLKQLKDKLSTLSVTHQEWYWQLDKDSKESKEYINKINSEIEEVKAQIQAKEELYARIQERKNRAGSDNVDAGLDRVYLLDTASDNDASAIANDYMSNPAVEYAEPNYKVKAQAVNDPYYSSSGSWGQSYGDLWGLKKINSDKAWDISQGDSQIVAIVDTGIDYSHEDISDNVWSNSGEIANNNSDDDNNGYVDDVKGYDFVNDDNEPKDGYGHGTHVAGTVAAVGNNSKGIIGLAYKAKVMAVKGLGDDGSGSIDDLAEGIRYAADNGADVINNSWGGSGGSALVRNAVEYAYNQGCVITAAAGNDGSRADDYYPANLDNVITVGSSDYDDAKSDFSNTGYKIDVVSPGGNSFDGNNEDKKYENILSLRASATDFYGGSVNIVNTNYYRSRGTSMACPYVSGLVALILSRKNTLSNEEVRQVIRASADDVGSSGFDTDTGFGRINAYKALQIDSVCAAKITSPKRNKLIKTGDISIEGKASGANFASYKVEYADFRSGGWSQIGNTGYSSVAQGALATVAINVPGQYYFKLTVTDNSGNNFQDVVGPVYIDKDIRSGWPQQTSNAQAYSTPFVVADVDNDGKQEVVVGDYAGKVHIFKHDGTYLDGWPLNLNSAIVSDISCADIDGDGDLEIFFACYNQYVYAYHHTGEVATGWPYYISDGTYPFCSLSLMDVDNDGNMDIVAFPASRYMHILNKSAEVISKLAPHDNWNRLVPEGCSLSFADMDKDGKPEMFLPLIDTNDSYYYLYVFDYQGNVLKKLKLDGITATVERLYKSIAVQTVYHPVRPVIGDLDNDGDLEIVIAKEHRNSHGSDVGKLFVWSFDNGNYNNTLATDIADTSRVSQLAIVDVDSDGDLEIVLGGTYLDSDGAENTYSYARVLDYNGQQLWKSAFYAYDSGFDASPVMADLNGDGVKEVVLFDSIRNSNRKHYQSLCVYSTTGSSYSNEYKIPRTGYGSTGWSIYSSPTIADLDGDGKIEVVAMNPGNGFIGVWDFSGSYDSSKLDWPMFQHDIYRSGNQGHKPAATSASDQSAPSGSITINSGAAYSKANEVTLNLSATDDTGVSGYYISVDGTAPLASDSNWVSVSSSKSYSADISYSLSTGEGSKTVYCWYKDAAKNVSERFQSVITLDSVAPVVSISSPTSGSSYTTTSSTVNLSGSASDSGSGLNSVTWSSDKGQSGTASGTSSWSVSGVSLSLGYNVITITARDSVGNSSSARLTASRQMSSTNSKVPSAPTNLKVKMILSTGVTFAWTDNASNELGFKVERSNSYSSGFVQIGITTRWHYSDSKLTSGKTYYYRVRAYNNSGNSGYSNILKVTTK